MASADAPKIAYLLPDPGIPVGGTKGASVHVESLCAAMARSGARVTLYAANVTGPLAAPGADAVTVVPVEVGHVRSGPGAEVSRMAAAARFFDVIGRSFAADRPDWAHERLSLFAGSGSDLCAAAGIGRVVEVNAPVADERVRHFGLEMAAEAHDAERAALGGARVLAVSQPLADWAVAVGAAEASVVPNGADTKGLDPRLWAARGARLRSGLGLDGRVVVGFAGSLKPWHGVELLFRAVTTMAQPDIGVLIVGDGPGRAATERAAAAMPPSVAAVVTGAVPFSQMGGYLAAMDICVAPYLPSDTFYFSPLKVAEGMAAARPVVASDFAPVRELLGPTGVLVEPGHVAQLGAAIEGLVVDALARARLGAAARARAVRYLDWDAVAGRTLSFAAPGACPGTGKDAR